MTMHPRTPAAEARTERRRSCWDRWRYQRYQRRRKPGDPAMGVAAQLLALVLILAGRAPILPLPRPVPVPAARLRPMPLRCREDWSPEQEAREHGEGGYLTSARRVGWRGGRYRTSPSYRRLLRDLRRSYAPARDEALDVLRRRLDLPPEAQGWIDEQAASGDWSPLAACIGGRIDPDAEIAVLHAAIAWLEAKRTDSDTPPPPPPPGGSASLQPPDDDHPGGPGKKP